MYVRVLNIFHGPRCRSPAGLEGGEKLPCRLLYIRMAFLRTEQYIMKKTKHGYVEVGLGSGGQVLRVGACLRARRVQLNVVASHSLVAQCCVQRSTSTFSSPCYSRDLQQNVAMGKHTLVF